MLIQYLFLVMRIMAPRLRQEAVRQVVLPDTRLPQSSLAELTLGFWSSKSAQLRHQPGPAHTFVSHAWQIDAGGSTQILSTACSGAGQ